MHWYTSSQRIAFEWQLHGTSRIKFLTEQKYKQWIKLWPQKSMGKSFWELVFWEQVLWGYSPDLNWETGVGAGFCLGNINRFHQKCPDLHQDWHTETPTLLLSSEHKQASHVAPMAIFRVLHMLREFCFQSLSVLLQAPCLYYLLPSLPLCFVLSLCKCCQFTSPTWKSSSHKRHLIILIHITAYFQIECCCGILA